MREFTSPMPPSHDLTGNLTDDVVRRAREQPRHVMFSRPSADGWADVTAERFHGEVAAVAKGLLAVGIGTGDRVALMARTTYEWTLLDYAIWYAGALTVPVYETASADQVEWVLRDSGAVAVVAEGAQHTARVAEHRMSLPELRHVWSLDDDAVEVLTRLGEGVGDSALEERRTAAGPEDPATIVYTSGTTGRPRGCVLTHGNLATELEAAIPALGELFDTEDAATLLFLPLAHVFARVVQVGAVRAGVRLAHASDIRHLPRDLESFRPTFLLAVPRVFEKLFTTASQRTTAEGRGRAFDRAADTAIAYSRAVDRGSVPLTVRARHAMYSRLVYPRLREALGGACRYAVSGGAPLGERLAHFYRGIGVTVLEGYGLTESAAAVTLNRPDALKIGTVGQPLPGTTIRVSDDGELLARGGQVFAGYWNDRAATREVLDNGWLRTGDLGEIDEEGFVRVTGRRTEILVTAGGKNVAPAVLEERVRAHPLVSQCLVVGDGRPFVAALVTLDADAVAAWAVGRGKDPRMSTLVDDDTLRGEIQAGIDDANLAVSQAESIRRFTVLPGDWTEEGGQLTPSQKLKRNVVLREYRKQISALFARPEGHP